MKGPVGDLQDGRMATTNLQQFLFEHSSNSSLTLCGTDIAIVLTTRVSEQPVALYTKIALENTH